MNTLQDTLSTLLPDARELMKCVMRTSEKIFAEQKEVEPVMFAIDPIGQIKVIDVPELSDETKPTVWAGLRHLRRSYPIVALISEVWMVHCPKGDPNMLPDGRVKVMPRDHPNRFEKVSIQLWQGERSVSFMCSINRNPDSLGEWEVMFDSDYPKDLVSLGGAMIDGESYPLKQN